MSRRAVRYVFPAYALCNLAGAQVVVDCAPRVPDFIRRHERRFEPALALFVVAATALRVSFWP